MPDTRPLTEKILAAEIAAAVRWAHEEDWTEATAPARAALERKFEDEVDPDRTLIPEERAKRVASAKRAYYARIALASVKARRKKAAS